MRRFPAVIGAVLASALVLVACSSGDDDGFLDSLVSSSSTTSSSSDAEPAPAGTLDWEDCGGGFQCGELSTPLDHMDPEGETIPIALIRRPADDPDERIGALLVNPGGPGASGVELARQADLVFGMDVLDRFDIVGFDPRGVGSSAAVDCPFELDRLFALDTTPDDEGELRELRSVSKEYADSCAAASGSLLEHVSTLDTARDMDLIREALGEEQISYIGFSYGTYLGALYAELFPDRVRALVLDGAVDPTLSDEEGAVQQSLGFEMQFEEFLEWCGSDSSCDFHSAGDPAAAYDELMQEIDADGIEASDGRVLGPGEADIAVVSALYDGQRGFTVLGDALDAAANGDPDPLMILFDSYVGRDGSGSYDGTQAAFQAIGCVDGTSTTTPDEHDDLAGRVGEAAPHFGESGVNLGYACVYWSATPDGWEGPVRATGAPPILVIGTRGDPATPPQWAESLADQLESGVLLRLDARGHLAYGLGYPCIDDAVDDYLIDLTVPDEGTTCEP